MPSLLVEDLEVRYGGIRGTTSVSFRVDEGEIVALAGSNGSGKSSTLKAILGLASYASGRITWDGTPLKGVPPHAITRRGIGYSPEGRRVFAQLSVTENLRMGGYTRSSAETSERAEQMFAYFPRLRERSRQLAGSLSGGEQQMLAIARALMGRPKLFLLDEPSLGLAPVIVDRIGEILAEIQQRERLSVIVAEQNVQWALRLAKRAVILELGRSLKEGPSDALMADEDVQRAYLGI